MDPKEEKKEETKVIPMGKTEFLEFENIYLKMEMLKNSREKLFSEVCLRVGEKRENLTIVNPHTGEMTFKIVPKK